MEEKAQLQLDALHTTLAFHKVKITEFNQTLGEEITGFPCENCKESAAKVELEIESDGEGY
ncbi:MAG: hypothetical protein BGO67_00255 [Alphaproteobacteria bacterium 41-28]|nr:MAG: hypothetical protein BGO67_00255 [Alphaproteobacteria bacterium 41-28]